MSTTSGNGSTDLNDHLQSETSSKLDEWGYYRTTWLRTTYGPASRYQAVATSTSENYLAIRTQQIYDLMERLYREDKITLEEYTLWWEYDNNKVRDLHDSQLPLLRLGERTITSTR